MNSFPMNPSASDLPDPDLAYRTGNTAPVLREILQALRDLAADGREHVIDLRSLPFGPGDERALKTALGDGEISALVQAFGESEVEETAYPGVWWIEHRDPEGAVIAKLIEITRVPNLLCSQSDDIAAAVARLNKALCGNDREDSGGS